MIRGILAVLLAVPGLPAQPDPLLQRLPADATNLIVIRDLLPSVETVLEAEVLREALAKTRAIQREVFGSELDAAQLKARLGLFRAFIPTEVVLAAPPDTITSLMRAGESALEVFVIAQHLTSAPGPDPDTIADLRRELSEALAAMRPPTAVAWVRMRDERIAERLFDTVLAASRNAHGNAGLAFEPGEDALTVRIRPLALQGGALAALLEGTGIDPEPHRRWELSASIELDGAELRLRLGDPAVGPLPAAALGPLWRPFAGQLAFVHYDWRDGAEILDSVIEQAYDAFELDLDEDTEIQLMQAISAAEGVLEASVVGATAVELDGDLVISTEEELAEEEEVDEPAPELVRCIEPDEGPFMLSALTLDMMLFTVLTDFEQELMQRADQAGYYEALQAMYDRFADAIDYISGADSVVFEPGVVIVTRSSGFRSLRETFTGRAQTWSRELPFASIALVAEAESAAAGSAFVDRLTGLIASGAGTDADEVWAEADLGLGVPGREMRWQQWLPEIRLDADCRPHCFLHGSFLVLSTDVGLSRELLGRMRGTDHVELPVARPVSWTRWRGEHLAGLCGGLAAWIGEAEARLGSPGSERSANLAQIVEMFSALQVLAGRVSMLEGYEQLEGRTYRSVGALRLRR